MITILIFLLFLITDYMYSIVVDAQEGLFIFFFNKYGKDIAYLYEDLKTFSYYTAVISVTVGILLSIFSAICSTGKFRKQSAVILLFLVLAILSLFALLCEVLGCANLAT